MTTLAFTILVASLSLVATFGIARILGAMSDGDDIEGDDELDNDPTEPK